MGAAKKFGSAELEPGCVASRTGRWWVRRFTKFFALCCGVPPAANGGPSAHPLALGTVQQAPECQSPRPGGAQSILLPRFAGPDSSVGVPRNRRPLPRESADPARPIPQAPLGSPHRTRRKYRDGSRGVRSNLFRKVPKAPIAGLSQPSTRSRAAQAFDPQRLSQTQAPRTATPPQPRK